MADDGCSVSTTPTPDCIRLHSTPLDAGVLTISCGWGRCYCDVTVRRRVQPERPTAAVRHTSSDLLCCAVQLFMCPSLFSFARGRSGDRRLDIIWARTTEIALLPA